MLLKMKELCVDKKDLKRILWELRNFQSVTNSVLNQYDENTLVKLYYQLFFEEYKTRNLDTLDSTIGSIRGLERLMKELLPSYQTSKEKMIHIINRLQYTESHDLIQGIVTYKEVVIAVFLNFYKDYMTYYELHSRLNQDENLFVLDKIEHLVNDLQNNYIYPTDIKFRNVMIRKCDLDVKLIDLDDSATIYAPKADPITSMIVKTKIKDMRNRALKSRN